MTGRIRWYKEFDKAQFPLPSLSVPSSWRPFFLRGMDMGKLPSGSGSTDLRRSLEIQSGSIRYGQRNGSVF
jgi:hypothetical protein